MLYVSLVQIFMSYILIKSLSLSFSIFCASIIIMVVCESWHLIFAETCVLFSLSLIHALSQSHSMLVIGVCNLPYTSQSHSHTHFLSHHRCSRTIACFTVNIAYFVQSQQFKIMTSAMCQLYWHHKCANRTLQVNASIRRTAWLLLYGHQDHVMRLFVTVKF